MKSKLFKEVKDILMYETSDLSYEELVEYIKEPMNYSCKNGCITSLIYHKDTYAFADRHYEEIVDLFEKLGICEMDKNKQAWIAFEYFAPEALKELVEDRKKENRINDDDKEDLIWMI